MADVDLERLQARYGGGSAQSAAAKKEISLGGPGRGGRDRALGAGGKPRNMRRTIVRLFRYLSQERLLLTLALVCAVVCTVSTLAAGYLLRPIMNRFLYFDPREADILRAFRRFAARSG